MYIYIYDIYIYMMYIYIYYKDTNEIWVKIAIFQMDADFPNQRGKPQIFFRQTLKAELADPEGILHELSWILIQNPGVLRPAYLG